MKRKSPVQMLMDKMNARINFKYVPLEEWDKINEELKIAEAHFELEIVNAYYAGVHLEHNNGSTYFEKTFK